MAYKEHIWSGETELALAKVYPLEHPWEAGVVLDQNECQKPGNEDVITLAEDNGALFLQVLDGISASQKPGTTQFGYDSGAVALHFAKQSLAYIQPSLEARFPIELNHLHQFVAKDLRRSFTNGEIPLGGLVGVSALFMPNGETRINRFGDTEGLLAKRGAAQILPPELYPENLALREYLQWCQEQNLKPDLERDPQWKERVLQGKGNDKVVINYLSSNQGNSRLTIGPDLTTMLSPEDGVLLATDGLKVFRNWKYLESYDWENSPVVELMKDIHKAALDISADNLSGAFIRMLK